MKPIARYLLQYIIKHGTVNMKTTLDHFKNIDEDSIPNITQLKSLLSQINNEISKQSFRIVSHTCEVTEQEMLVFVNLKNDDLAKLQIVFTKLELEFFHLLIESILESENRAISFISAINLTSSTTAHFSRSDGQKSLDGWISGGYFVRDEENVYFGPRLILEFVSFLKTRVEDSDCGLCEELMFVGKTCESCNKSFHSHCIGKYLKSTKKCPSCQSEWSEISVPEVAQEMEYEETQDSD